MPYKQKQDKLNKAYSFDSIEQKIGFIVALFIIPVGIILLFLPQINESISAKNLDIIVKNNSILESVNFGKYPRNLTTLVTDAKDMLRNSASLSYEEKNGKVYKKEIALALLNLENQSIVEKRFWVFQDDIENINYANREGVILEQSGSLPIIKNDIWNSFNSEYSAFPRKYIPLANKYLYPSERIFDNNEKNDDKLTEIIYAPYSKWVHNPQLVNEGIKYLTDTMNKARAELEDVPSKNNNVFVPEYIPDKLSFYIVLIEHIDPELFLHKNTTEEEKKRMVERVLIRFALNKGSTFRYTGSTANAWGSTQFTKPTYLAMVNQYPQANLIQTFKMGTIDDKNSFKAMMLLFDNLKEYFSDLVSERIFTSTDVEEMIAGGYNGNPARVRRSISMFDEEWFERQVDKNYFSLLKKETKQYILKLREVREYSYFNQD